MNSNQSAWQECASGVKTSFYLEVVARANGAPVSFPVIVASGQQPGKTLLVSAGVHGDEFEGMAALRRLFGELEPAKMAGTFVAVPIVNPPAYEAGLRTNPHDRQDMARIFPGVLDGTVTEQLAYAMTHSFIRHADFYCDLHSAGQYYAMPPLVGYQLQPEPLLSRQREAARAFGMPVIWGTGGLPGRSLSAAAEHGVPAIYAEITGQGRCLNSDVQMYLSGLRRLLHHLEITEQNVAAADPPICSVEDDRIGAGHLQVQNRAPAGGFFEAEASLLDRVDKGQPIGVIRNPLGEVIHVVEATCAGLLVFLRTFPRVHAGDPICMVMETNTATSRSSER